MSVSIFHIATWAFLKPTRGRFAQSDLSGLSGGDILITCLNAIYAGSTDANPEHCEVSQVMIEAETNKARKAKAAHSGGLETRAVSGERKGENTLIHQAH